MAAVPRHRPGTIERALDAVGPDPLSGGMAARGRRPAFDRAPPHAPRLAMSDAPAITVLLPVRNAAPYLREALESLRHQSFTRFRILAIDDGSADESPA